MGQIYDRSIFKPFFEMDDAAVEAWAENVAKKLQQKGIVAEFVKRDFEAESGDYYDLFYSLSQFFAYVVVLGRQFEEFYDFEEILANFILQRGLFLPNKNINLGDFNNDFSDDFLI